jgi:hypothetical protein
MSRALASLLLVLISFPLIAPAIAAKSTSNLPACCRRDGAHHCAMFSSELGTQGPSFQAVRQKCPYFPATTVTSAQGKAAVLRTLHAIVASAARYPAALPRTESQYHTSFSRSRQKRGPPSLVA